MDGLDCFGCETAVGFDFMDLVKKEGPTLISNVTEELKDKKGGAAGTGTPPVPIKKSQKSWFLRPVLGPIPGIGVLAIGAALLGGAGFAVKKIFF